MEDQSQTILSSQKQGTFSGGLGKTITPQNKSLSVKFSNTPLFSDTSQWKEGIKITKELNNEEETTLILLDVLVAHSKLPVMEWVTKNERIKKIYLQHFFVRFI